MYVGRDSIVSWTHYDRLPLPIPVLEDQGEEEQQKRQQKQQRRRRRRRRNKRNNNKIINATIMGITEKGTCHTHGEGLATAATAAAAASERKEEDCHVVPD